MSKAEPLLKEEWQDIAYDWRVIDKLVWKTVLTLQESVGTTKVKFISRILKRIQKARWDLEVICEKQHGYDFADKTFIDAESLKEMDALSSKLAELETAFTL